MRARSGVVVVIAVVAILLLAGRAVTALVVDHAWYVAMGIPTVFWERVSATALLQGGAWLVGGLFAFANLHAVRQTIRAVAVPSRLANLDFTAMIPPRRLLSITIVCAALIGLGLALPLTDWTPVSMARHGVPFSEIEGILDHDLGFYVYRLPLEETAYIWSLVTLIVMIAVVTLLYALTRSVRMDGRRIIASTHARRHLSVLGALVLLLLAWSYRLDGFDLLQFGSGPDGLFLRIDHSIALQVDRVLVMLCGIAAPIFLRAAWLGQLRGAFVTLSIVLTAAIGGRYLLPIALNRSSWIGDPSTRDLPYVAARTLYSRRAFDVDGIRAVPGDTLLARRDSARTRLSLRDLGEQASVWDPQSLSSRAADGRGTLVDVTPPSWTRDERGRITAISVRRPLAVGDPWVVTAADVTQPALRDSVLDVDFADTAEESEGPIVAPGMQGIRLVRDPAGVMGTPLRGWGMRIAHAWAERDPSLLRAESTDGPASRLVSSRDVRERVQRVAPIFVQSDEVTPLVHNGTVLWALSLYSASDHYPLSQRWMIRGAARSYFRLAATALVDANTGRIRLIPVARPDPIARTWLARVPALVVAPPDLPPGLLDQLPTPTDGVVAQLQTFARYGSRSEGAIIRQIPDSLFESGAPPMHLIRGAGASSAPAWSVPLLAGEQIDGILTAVGGRYRGAYWDSTTVPRARWAIAVERLRAALDSSRASLPDGTRREPRIRFGRVHVVAGERGPILLQALFWNQADGAPLVRRVAVSDGARVGLGATATEAAAMLRGTPIAGGGAAWQPADGADRDARMARLYDVMRDAMRRGDWTRFGAAFDTLGLVVGRPPRE
ncbi:MAG: UPF0182 family protein [Gemmatimonadaceae bacterium]|nr:UPF0182 family protein [Gemmatimonadaceae bacterium]